MTVTRRTILNAALVAPALAALPGRGIAQEFPARPLKFVVPYPAGGITDLLPRFMQEFLTARWKQPIVVENKPATLARKRRSRPTPTATQY